MADLTEDQRAALSAAQAVLQETSNPVAVRYVDREQDIIDTRFLVILFESKGYLFDRTKGSTQILDLAFDQSKADSKAAIIDAAKVAAHQAGLSVVYLIDR